MTKLDQPVDHSMSFGDHLDELRKRLVLAIAAPIPLAVVALFFTDTLIELLLLPLFRAQAAHGLPQQVQSLSPPEVVFVQLKLSILVAAVISAPWMLWQAWLFISPGLHHHERRFVNLLVPGSAILTITGVALLYFAMLPIMLSVMVGIGANVKVRAASVEIDARVADVLRQSPEILVLTAPPADPQPGQAWLVWPDLSRGHIAVANAAGGVEVLPLPAIADATIAQQYRLSEYVNFVLVLMVGIVIGFQMPLVVMLLGWINVASPAWFRKQRKYALFGCAAASAIITPSSDLISMLIMMLPLYALYELGIVLLVLAPASKVAEGRVIPLPRWRWKRAKPDNPIARAAKSASMEQSERSIARRSAQTDSSAPPADEEETRR